MRILLQFPEGLKKEAKKFVDKYEKEGHEVFIASAPCYGACDLAIDEARWVKADKLVHIGHAQFVKKKLPIEVEYIEYFIDVQLEQFKAALPVLEQYKKIALATTVQHVHQFKEMKKLFEDAGKDVFSGTGFWAIREGQVLGCDSIGLKKVEKDVDAIVFVGDGMFHALAIETEKPTFVIHPQTGKIRQINDDINKLAKKRKGSVLVAVHSKTFGILVSTKVGQFYLKSAQWAKTEIEKRGKTAMILVANELEPLPINNFLIFDCYINTACPRMVDDTDEFGKPMLSLEMLREVLNTWDALEKK
ncbi:MAG: diphthamide biosynthesis enzyme Dph2 [Candidatus Micrarchaeota archaeon]|nr:diphthamide biosynthesis enzyme Dph2 [Candidatus Micrarchaeota archaeon]